MKNTEHYWITTPTEFGGVYISNGKITHTSSFVAHTIGWSWDAFLVYCKAKKWMCGPEFQFRGPQHEWNCCICPSCVGEDFDYEDELPEEAFSLPDRLARKWGFVCK